MLSVSSVWEGPLTAEVTGRASALFSAEQGKEHPLLPHHPGGQGTAGRVKERFRPVSPIQQTLASTLHELTHESPQLHFTEEVGAHVSE